MRLRATRTEVALTLVEADTSPMGMVAVTVRVVSSTVCVVASTVRAVLPTTRVATLAACSMVSAYNRPSRHGSGVMLPTVIYS